MYRYFKETATVYRMVTVSGKSTYSATGNSYKWYLKPAWTEDSLYQDKFWQDYYFTTVNTADIKNWDQLIINNEEYKVKWFWNWNWIVLRYKKFIIVKV